MSRKGGKTIAIILLLLYLAAVAYACFGHFDNTPQIEKTFFGLEWDKVVHFVMFLPFPFLTFLVFSDSKRKAWKNLMILLASFIVGCLVAASTEVLQSFTDYRTGDKLDFAADFAALSLSSLVTAIIYLIIHGRQSKKQCTEE